MQIAPVVRRFILMLKEGFLVKKHGRRGAARERFVRLSEAGDEQRPFENG